MSGLNQCQGIRPSRNFGGADGAAGCRLAGCWPCSELASLHTPGFDVEVTVPASVTGSNEYTRSAGPVLPSGHVHPVETPRRSAVQGPPATLLIAPTHPRDVATVPPQVRSALHCVVMLQVVGGPSVTRLKSPSSWSSADAGLAKPIAVQVTAMAAAIARVIAIGRASHVSAEAGQDIAKVEGHGLLELFVST